MNPASNNKYAIIAKAIKPTIDFIRHVVTFLIMTTAMMITNKAMM